MKKLIALALLACPIAVCAKGKEDNPTSVVVENTPSVEIVNTPSVSIDGTPSVQLDGVPEVTVTNEVATDPRVRHIPGLDITSFGFIIDSSAVCDDPANSPPCRLWGPFDTQTPASLTHLAVAVGESTSTGDSKCSVSVVHKNDTLGIYRALINLRSQAGSLRTFERTYPIPVDLSDPDSFIEVSGRRISGTGNCMFEFGGFGTQSPLD